VALPGLPWSPDFMATYEAALADASRIEIGSTRTRPGTVAAAVAGYFGSAVFAMGLAESTRRTRRQILERFRAEHGDKGIATLGKTHVERMVNARAGTPGAALNFAARPYATRDNGRVACRRSDRRGARPQVPLPRVLHVDRRRYRCIRSEAPQGNSGSARAGVAPVHGPTAGRWGASTSEMAC
jgi:hypothetical protein